MFTPHKQLEKLLSGIGNGNKDFGRLAAERLGHILDEEPVERLCFLLRRAILALSAYVCHPRWDARLAMADCLEACVKRISAASNGHDTTNGSASETDSAARSGDDDECTALVKRLSAGWITMDELAMPVVLAQGRPLFAFDPKELEPEEGDEAIDPADLDKRVREQRRILMRILGLEAATGGSNGGGDDGGEDGVRRATVYGSERAVNLITMEDFGIGRKRLAKTTPDGSAAAPPALPPLSAAKAAKGEPQLSTRLRNALKRKSRVSAANVSAEGSRGGSGAAAVGGGVIGPAEKPPFVAMLQDLGAARRHAARACASGADPSTDGAAAAGTADSVPGSGSGADGEWASVTDAILLLMTDLASWLFHPSWQHRHGAAVALSGVMRALLLRPRGRRGNDSGRDGGGAGGNGGGTAVAPAVRKSNAGATRPGRPGLGLSVKRSTIARLAEDAAARCLCVLALDRFGDYGFGAVVAPVRETAAQALAVASLALPPATLVAVARAARLLTLESHWEVRHGGLLGLQYLAALNSSRDETCGASDAQVGQADRAIAPSGTPVAAPTVMAAAASAASAASVAVAAAAASAPSVAATAAQDVLSVTAAAALRGLADSEEDVCGVAARALCVVFSRAAHPSVPQGKKGGPAVAAVGVAAATRDIFQVLRAAWAAAMAVHDNPVSSSIEDVMRLMLKCYELIAPSDNNAAAVAAVAGGNTTVSNAKDAILLLLLWRHPSAAVRACTAALFGAIAWSIPRLLGTGRHNCGCGNGGCGGGGGENGICTGDQSGGGKDRNWACTGGSPATLPAAAAAAALSAAAAAGGDRRVGSGGGTLLRQCFWSIMFDADAGVRAASFAAWPSLVPASIRCRGWDGVAATRRLLNLYLTEDGRSRSAPTDSVPSGDAALGVRTAAAEAAPVVPPEAAGTTVRPHKRGRHTVLATSVPGTPAAGFGGGGNRNGNATGTTAAAARFVAAFEAEPGAAACFSARRIACAALGTLLTEVARQSPGASALATIEAAVVAAEAASADGAFASVKLAGMMLLAECASAARELVARSAGAADSTSCNTAAAALLPRIQRIVSREATGRNAAAATLSSASAPSPPRPPAFAELRATEEELQAASQQLMLVLLSGDGDDDDSERENEDDNERAEDEAAWRERIRLLQDELAAKQRELQRRVDAAAAVATVATTSTAAIATAAAAAAAGSPLPGNANGRGPRSAAAGLVAGRMLPPGFKLNPVVRPLMEAIKCEPDDSQRQWVAQQLATLILMLAATPTTPISTASPPSLSGASFPVTATPLLAPRQEEQRLAAEALQPGIQGGYRKACEKILSNLVEFLSGGDVPSAPHRCGGARAVLMELTRRIACVLPSRIAETSKDQKAEAAASAATITAPATEAAAEGPSSADRGGEAWAASWFCKRLDCLRHSDVRNRTADAATSLAGTIVVEEFGALALLEAMLASDGGRGSGSGSDSQDSAGTLVAKKPGGCAIAVAGEVVHNPACVRTVVRALLTADDGAGGGGNRVRDLAEAALRGLVAAAPAVVWPSICSELLLPLVAASASPAAAAPVMKMPKSAKLPPPLPMPLPPPGAAMAESVAAAAAFKLRVGAGIRAACEGMGVVAVLPYASTLLAAVLHGVTDADTDVRAVYTAIFSRLVEVVALAPADNAAALAGIAEGLSSASGGRRLKAIEASTLPSTAKVETSAANGGAAAAASSDAAAALAETGALITRHLIRGEPLRQLGRADLPPPAVAAMPPEVTLRRYQWEGVTWLRFLARTGLSGILADEMGLGKTLQALVGVAMECLGRDGAAGRALVVCPSTLVHHWNAEALRFFGGAFRPLLYAGPPAARAAAAASLDLHNLVVTTYAVLRQDVDFLASQAWGYVVIDEAHLLKNPASQAWAAARRLRAPRRLALTGTPIQNSVAELWAVVELVMPGYLGDRRDFQRRFAGPIRAAMAAPAGDGAAVVTGLAALEQLHRRVLPFILRREKAQVLADLPPKIVSDVRCDMSDAQRHLYRRLCATMGGGAASEVLERVEAAGTSGDNGGGGNGGMASDASAQALRWLSLLQLVCVHPALVMSETGAVGERRRQLLQSVEVSGKLTALRQLLVDCGIAPTDDATDSADVGDEEGGPRSVESGGGGGSGGDVGDVSSGGGNERGDSSSGSGRKCLIFAQHRSCLDALETCLFRGALPSVAYLRMDGATPVARRAAVLARFAEDPVVSVLLLTTRVGGLGLNLVAADTVIFVEHDWNPQADLQAIDRAHRIGQSHTVNVYRLVTADSVEERIMAAQARKVAVADAIVNTDNTSLYSMDTGGVLGLLDTPQAALPASSPSMSSAGAAAAMAAAPAAGAVLLWGRCRAAGGGGSGKGGGIGGMGGGSRGVGGGGGGGIADGGEGDGGGEAALLGGAEWSQQEYECLDAQLFSRTLAGQRE